MQDIDFQNVNISFNLAFDLGEPVNPIDAARNLLSADFAGGFWNHTTGEQEIAERFKEQTDEYKKCLEVRKILDDMPDNPGWGSYIRLIRLDPLKWGPIVFNAIRATYQEQEEEAPNQENEAEEAGARTAEDTPGQEKVEENGSRPSSTEEEAPSDTIWDESQDSVADFVLTLLGRLAICASVDETIFHEDYLERVPFVRASMQPFTVIWNNQQVSFDVTVTIQRSGIAILTCHGLFPSSLDVQEIISLRRASLLPFDACEIPATIVGRFYELSFGDFGKDELNHLYKEFAAPDRVDWLRFDEMDGESTLAGLFDAYRYAIIECIQGKRYESLDSLHQSLRSNRYFGYPIVFVNYPGTNDELKTQSGESLARLIMGFTSKPTLKPSAINEILDEDLSNTDDTSLYLTEGSALVIDYGEVEEDQSQRAEWIHESYMTAVPIDILLLQRTILGIYGAQLEGVTLDSTGLEQLYKIRRELLSGLDEYHVLGISHYGSVHDSIKRGQDHLRIKDSYDLFNQRLMGVDSLVQMAEGKREANHERFTRIATILISALLSLTVAHDIVSILGGWSVNLSRSYPPMLEVPFHFIVEQIKSRPTYSTLIIYLIFFCAILITLFGSSFTSWPRKAQTAVPKTEPERSSPKSLAPIQMIIQNSPDETESE